MWSPQQRHALDRVGRWIEKRDKSVFQLAGYAGTGKTTLAKHLAASVGGMVYFAAYTGKAAHVLSRSGATNVSTIHKLIYQPKDKSEVRLKELYAQEAELKTRDPVPRKLLKKVENAILAEKTNLARPLFQLQLDSPLRDASLLVVDEYSMIDERMGEDLLSFGCPILALGDPGQLPPVQGRSFFNDEPDILLTEIHRQAAENPIIWMSKEVREGRSLKPGAYGDSRVIPYERIGREELKRKVLDTDQLLVGKNATRISSNSRVRQIRGFTDSLPKAGDKLVCLRNDHQVGLLNGQLWEVVEDSTFDGSYVFLEIRNEDGAELDAYAHVQYFYGQLPAWYELREAQCFDYGYALTVHKAQGSQWDDVLLFDEWYSKDRRKWLYTALTRAAQRIDVICM